MSSNRMQRLNQILAVFTAHQKAFKDALTVADRHMSSTGDQIGHRKRYTSKEEDGEQFPDSVQHVKARAVSLITSVAAAAKSYVNAASARDFTNTSARANVEIDGKVIFENVPVTHLLFLESLLTGIQTWLSRANVRDTTEQWDLNPDTRLWQSAPTSTQKVATRKKPLTLAPATDKHPAQVQLIDESVVIGTWETVIYSGALPGVDRDRLLQRTSALLSAVKRAREEANTIAATEPRLGDKLVEFLFGDVIESS